MRQYWTKAKPNIQRENTEARNAMPATSSL